MNDTDHDILIRVETKQNALMKQFSNHLSHHFHYSIMAWGIALSAVVSLAIIVIKVL